MTILLIEDNRVLRLATERMLVKAGYSVIAVGDGQEGLHRAEELRPDLILLDMMLPTMDGTGVLRELKGNPQTKSIPVVVLSGLSQRNGQKLMRSGAAAFLEKTALLSDGGGNMLPRLIENLLSERQPGTENCYPPTVAEVS